MRRGLHVLMLPTLFLMALAPGARGAAPCPHFLPELDDEVLVLFERGDPRQPTLVGSLWPGGKAAPQKTPALPAPSALASDLLDARRDAEPGQVARRLLEAVSAEQERLYEQLERAYQSSFVAKAGGGVFAANVKVAIDQMEAYADLLEDIRRTVDAFRAAVQAGDDRQRSWADARLLAHTADLVDLELSLREPDCKDD